MAGTAAQPDRDEVLIAEMGRAPSAVVAAVSKVLMREGYGGTVQFTHAQMGEIPAWQEDDPASPDERAVGVTVFVAVALLFLAFIDHHEVAIQTLFIIAVRTRLSVLRGGPIGILIARSNPLRRGMIPVPDLLQILPGFVHLIPPILLFSAAGSTLHGIAIILYAIAPVIRVTDLGIRLVDEDVIEPADAFGMTDRQKLFGARIPLALGLVARGLPGRRLGASAAWPGGMSEPAPTRHRTLNWSAYDASPRERGSLAVRFDPA